MFKITILAVGQKMPSWIDEGCFNYLKRFKSTISVKLIPLPSAKREQMDSLSAMRIEAQSIRAAIPAGSYTIALAIDGKQCSSEQLADKLDKYRLSHSHICYIIGGPDGLDESMTQHCQESWSLSKLTLPHPLARVILLESIYRAWSILNNHPYHK